jgi:hypothetical protein
MFYDKYLKYKNKYIELKKQIGGVKKYITIDKDLLEIGKMYYFLDYYNEPNPIIKYGKYVGREGNIINFNTFFIKEEKNQSEKLIFIEENDTTIDTKILNYTDLKVGNDYIIINLPNKNFIGQLEYGVFVSKDTSDHRFIYTFNCLRNKQNKLFTEKKDVKIFADEYIYLNRSDFYLYPHRFSHRT